MPATRIECCGRIMSIDEALAHTDRCPTWTWELLAAVLHSQTLHPSNEDPTRISATVLTSKCLRQLTLERYETYTIDPSKLYKMFRGTQFHGQLEEMAHRNAYAEARFYVHDLGTKLPAVLEALPDDDRSFSGAPDLVRPKQGILYDYKRTGQVPRFNYPWQDHVAQLNINRWLVDHSDTVRLMETRPAFLQNVAGNGYAGDDGLDAGLITLEWLGAEVWTTWDMTHEDVRARFVPYEWQELIVVYVDDDGPKPLKCTESIRIPAKKGGTKPARVPVVWDDERAERYISERYIAARHALNARLAPIPSGWEFQSHILCQHCPVRRLCAEHERNGQ